MKSHASCGRNLQYEAHKVAMMAEPKREDALLAKRPLRWIYAAALIEIMPPPPPPLFRKAGCFRKNQYRQ